MLGRTSQWLTVVQPPTLASLCMEATSAEVANRSAPSVSGPMRACTQLRTHFVVASVYYCRLFLQRSKVGLQSILQRSKAHQFGVAWGYHINIKVKQVLYLGHLGKQWHFSGTPLFLQLQLEQTMLTHPALKSSIVKTFSGYREFNERSDPSSMMRKFS